MKAYWSRCMTGRGGCGVMLALTLLVVGRVPFVQGRTPSVENPTRPAKKRARPIQGRIPAVPGRTQTSQGRTPAVESDQQTIEVQAPTAEDRPRAVRGRTPALEGRTQGVEGRAQAVKVEPQGVENRPRTARGRTQAVENRFQGMRRRAPSGGYVDPLGGMRLRPDRSGRYLYVWAGHENHDVADFLAVIDFDEDSPGYGRVVNMVPLPGPGATFNEPHHMSLSVDGNFLGCGGLLSVLSGQPGIFFFDTSNPREPRFLFSTSDKFSSITDDFHPLPQGGFLVTQMGSADGGSPGRVVEFDRNLRQVGSWPSSPPTDGFNPHGISVRPEVNLMMTSDFVLPSSTLSVAPGPPVLRNTIRVWNYQKRTIVKTIPAPDAVGTMDVKLIPGDRRGRAYTAGMFNGLIYLIDPISGAATPVFDTSPQGGMPQILQLNRAGTRLFTGLFQSGRIIMLDTTRRFNPRLVASVDLGEGAGPHNLTLTDDGERLVVTDYFLDEDDFPAAKPGKVRLGGDHKVHVLKTSSYRLEIDARFQLDFNTAFSNGPARPHGVAIR